MKLIKEIRDKKKKWNNVNKYYAAYLHLSEIELSILNVEAKKEWISKKKEGEFFDLAYGSTFEGLIIAKPK